MTTLLQALTDSTSKVTTVDQTVQTIQEQSRKSTTDMETKSVMGSDGVRDPHPMLSASLRVTPTVPRVRSTTPR
jgi:hypothetical protein